MMIVTTIRSGLLLALALSSCVTPGPSAQRVTCLQGCAREKDDCLLAATQAEAIRQCDGASRRCGIDCPQ